MERKYKLVFKTDSIPGHHWRGEDWIPPNGVDDTDRRQHWIAGETFSEFTWDEEKNGLFKPEFDIFEVVLIG
jgi:hypothetical protein